MFETPTKLYSQKAISIATFFGGPLAAGILVRRNYINLGNDLYGKHAIVVGIVSTVIMFLGIFSIPEEIIDKTHNSLIPAIYTTIIYLVVEKLMGAEIKKHKEEGKEFYSGWNAAAVGFFSMCLLILGVIGFAMASEENFDVQSYDSGIESFTKNEEAALKMYNMLETGDTESASIEIKKSSLPLWIENINILNQLNLLENLPAELKDQNTLLIEYCQLRIKECRLISKAIEENSDKYDMQIELAHLDIEQILEKLSNQ